MGAVWNICKILCEWMSEQGQSGMVKGQKLLRPKKSGTCGDAWSVLSCKVGEHKWRKIETLKLIFTQVDFSLA